MLPPLLLLMQMYPRLLIFDTEVITAHMSMLKALVSRSSLWSSQARCSASSGRTSQARCSASVERPSPALYPGHAGAQAFLAEARAALRQFFPELTRREIADMASTHWAQYKLHIVPVDGQSKQMQQAAQLAGGSHLVSGSSSCASSTMVGAGSASAGSDPGLPSTTRQAEDSSTLLGDPQAAGQLQPAQQLEQTAEDAAAAWPLKLSRNPSGRTLLRMEYLLAMGLDAEVSILRLG